MHPIRLSQGSLGQLGAAVGRPGYDRSVISPGIVGFGLGGLCRAHHAMYLDWLMEGGLAHDFGMVGVGVSAGDREVVESMRRQDCLYTLVVKHPDGRWSARVMGAILQVLFAPEEPQEVLARMSDPATRIVSLTIAEHGYLVDLDTGRFDATHPSIQHDLRPGALPCSVFGFMVEALRRRRAAGLAPFTVMSCDDMPGNGDIARRMLTAFARLKDPQIAEWIESEVRFPSCVVDRVTCAAGQDDGIRLRDEFGLDDGATVVAEPFTQWVLEDDFSSGRPPYEHAGVQITDDVVPHALLKMRLAGVSRLAMGYLGSLAGRRLAREVCADELFTGFLTGYLRAEGIPTLPPLPGVDVDGYCRALLTRLADAQVDGLLSRWCTDGSDHLHTWLAPVIEDNVWARRQVRHAALVVAAWARCAEGVDEHGSPLDIVDPLGEQLIAATARQREDPLVLLRNPFLFGGLIDTPEFTEPYRELLASLHTAGVRRTMARLTAGELQNLPAD